MKIIFATHNNGKIKEMRALLSGFDVFSAEEAGVTEDVVEDGKSLKENAFKKARFVNKKTGALALADDTGLFIDALGGRPGIHAARWAGDNSSDDDKINKVLNELKGVEPAERTAYFESCVALVGNGRKEQIFFGRLNGFIILKPRGTLRTSLPYDLVFAPRGHKRTFAEMSDEEKNSLSHRGLAFRKARDFLLKIRKHG